VSTDSGLGLEEEQVERERRRIEPDTGAVTSLLNFDEIDDWEDDGDDSDDGCDHEEGRAQGFNQEWRRAVVKDLASLGAAAIRRRHSQTRADRGGGAGGGGGATTSLSLREVGHIRRVLANAEQEGVGREDCSKVCGVCRAGFPLFRLPAECEVCEQSVCGRCCAQASRTYTSTLYQLRDIPTHLLTPLPPHSTEYSAGNCAGSAPSSPAAARQCLAPRQVLQKGAVDSPAHCPALPAPPPHTSLSLLPPHSRLRGAAILCLPCLDTVKQIIRTQGHNRRLAGSRKL